MSTTFQGRLSGFLLISAERASTVWYNFTVAENGLEISTLLSSAISGKYSSLQSLDLIMVLNDQHCITHICEWDQLRPLRRMYTKAYF